MKLLDALSFKLSDFFFFAALLVFCSVTQFCRAQAARCLNFKDSMICCLPR